MTFAYFFQLIKKVERYFVNLKFNSILFKIILDTCTLIREIEKDCMVKKIKHLICLFLNSIMDIKKLNKKKWNNQLLSDQLIRIRNL